MDSVFDNPISLIFISYAIGAFIDPFIKKKNWYTQISSYDAISDKTTKYLGVLFLNKICESGVEMN